MDPIVQKRIDRAISAGYTAQPRHGGCVVCLRDWDSCPHTRAEVDEAFEVRLRQRRLDNLKP